MQFTFKLATSIQWVYLLYFFYQWWSSFSFVQDVTPCHIFSPSEKVERVNQDAALSTAACLNALEYSLHLQMVIWRHACKVNRMLKLVTTEKPWSAPFLAYQCTGPTCIHMDKFQNTFTNVRVISCSIFCIWDEPVWKGLWCKIKILPWNSSTLQCHISMKNLHGAISERGWGDIRCWIYDEN